MKARVGIIALVLAGSAGLLASCGGSTPPTRAQIEADTDRFCRAVARARELEREYGLDPNTPDGGDAGAK